MARGTGDGSGVRRARGARRPCAAGCRPRVGRACVTAWQIELDVLVQVLGRADKGLVDARGVRALVRPRVRLARHLVRRPRLRRAVESERLAGGHGRTVRHRRPCRPRTVVVVRGRRALKRPFRTLRLSRPDRQLVHRLRVPKVGQMRRLPLELDWLRRRHRRTHGGGPVHSPRLVLGVVRRLATERSVRCCRPLLSLAKRVLAAKTKEVCPEERGRCLRSDRAPRGELLAVPRLRGLLRFPRRPLRDLGRLRHRLSSSRQGEEPGGSGAAVRAASLERKTDTQDGGEAGETTPRPSRPATQTPRRGTHRAAWQGPEGFAQKQR